MTALDWDDLERAWQSLPRAAAPVADELIRGQQRRWLSSLLLWSEVAGGVAGVGVGVWVLMQGVVGTFDLASTVTGVATLVFTSFVAGTSWWARSLAPVRADDPVMFALDAAVRRAQIGVRLAIANLWSLAGGLVFMALLLAVMETQASPRGYAVIAALLVWMALWLAGTTFYFARRTADLARLQALRESLST